MKGYRKRQPQPCHDCSFIYGQSTCKGCWVWRKYHKPKPRKKQGKVLAKGWAVMINKLIRRSEVLQHMAIYRERRVAIAHARLVQGTVKRVTITEAP